MQNLNTPSIDPSNALNNVILAKQEPRQSRLRDISDLINSRFDEYDLEKYTLENIRTYDWGSVQKMDMEHCYDKETVPLNKLKNHIKAVQSPSSRRMCHYCGLDSVGSGFDHYLPKELYPEYAVYSLNLLPCCSTCNSMKWQNFLIDKERQFLHFYYDHIPSSQFLHVEIVEFRDQLVAEYYLSNSVNSLIQRHYSNLNLFSRYSVASSEVFSEIKVSLNNNQITSLLEAQYLLQTKTKDYQDMLSENYWKVVLYKQIIVDVKVLEKLMGDFVPL